MDYSWAKPGVKVVCVDAALQDLNTIERNVVEGRVYTIRGLDPDGYEGVHLEEIKNPQVLTWAGMKERTFRISRFRPLITKTQEEDVALFKSLLTGAPVGVEA